MDIKDIFTKAEKMIKQEIREAEEGRQREQIEILKLQEKIMGLYVRTVRYREEAYFILAKAIQEDKLIEGEKVRFECGTVNKRMAQMKCDCCGAEVFNLLDKDYVEIYDQTRYCFECVLCGQRKWYKLDKVEFEEVKKEEEENVEINYEIDYEEDEECEQ